jgi:lipopolysaccharide export system permease protein
MFKIVQRYLGSNFIIPFVMSSTFFVIFLLIFQLFRITRYVIAKGVAWDIVLELMLHISISFIPMAIPLSALFATIYTLGKLSEDSEIVAMRSFGYSRFRLLVPFIILGLLIAAMVFSLNRNIIPNSKRLFKNAVVKLTSKSLLADIKQGNFFVDIPNVTLFASDKSKDGKVLKNVFINFDNNSGEKVIMAREGIIIKQQFDRWGSGSLRMRLKDGNIIETTNGESQMRKVLFEEYELPVMDGDLRAGLVTKDGMRTNEELYQILKTTPWEQRKTKGFIKTQLEFWTRFNTPLQCFAFILLGFTLGIKQGRGRSRSSGALALGIVTIYYVIFFLGISLARKGSAPPALAVFLPTALSFIAAAHFYKRLNWVR